MKRLFLLAAVLAFYLVPASCQEIVVFKDDRSLSVKSHHEKDGFVFIRLGEGEFAVPKSQIKEIKKETPTAGDPDQGGGRGSSVRDNLPRRPSIGDTAGQPGRKPGMRSARPSPKPQPEEAQEQEEDEEDEGEGEAAEEAEEDQAEEPEPPPSPTPPQVQQQPRRSLTPVNRKR